MRCRVELRALRGGAVIARRVAWIDGGMEREVAVTVPIRYRLARALALQVVASGDADAATAIGTWRRVAR